MISQKNLHTGIQKGNLLHLFAYTWMHANTILATDILLLCSCADITIHIILMCAVRNVSTFITEVMTSYILNIVINMYIKSMSKLNAIIHYFKIMASK